MLEPAGGARRLALAGRGEKVDHSGFRQGQKKLVADGVQVFFAAWAV